MRLLVFTPTYTLPSGEDAMALECEESIRSQVVDCDLTYEIGRYNPYPAGDLRNVFEQYRQAQKMFLAGDWDAMLTVEHDNALPDSGAIQRLLDTPGDIVYAPYLLRHGSAVLSAWQYVGDKNLGESLSLHGEELARAREAVVWRICGVGNGCTLIRRRVLERIQYRPQDGPGYSSDLLFAQDALKEGFVSNGRFDVPVLHKQGAEWLDPYAGVKGQQYLCLVSANAMADDGARFKLVKGQAVEMTPSQAFDMIRAGFLQAIVVERPAFEPETATAEPEVELAILPAPKRRKRVVSDAS